MKYLVSLASRYIGRQKFRTVLTFLSIMLASFMMSMSLFALNSAFASVKEFSIEENGRWEADLTDVFMEEMSDERYDKFVKLKDHVLVESASCYSRYGFYKEIISDKNMSEEEKQIYDADRFEITFDGKYTVYANFLYQMSSDDDDELFGKYSGVSYDTKKVNSKDGIVLSKSLKQYGYKTGDRINIAVTPVSIDGRGETYEDSFTIEGFSNIEFANIFSFSEEAKSRDDYIMEFCANIFFGRRFLENLFDKNVEYMCENYNIGTDYTVPVRINDGVEFDEAVDCVLSDIGSFMEYADLMQGDKLNSTLLLLELKALVNPGLFIVIAAFVFAFLFMIWLLTRLIIDNAFEISVAERNRKYTLLKTFGASKRQLKTLTFAEAVFYCITAVPLGILMAYVIIKSLLVSFRNSGIYGIVFKADPVVTAVGFFLCIISVIISSFTSAMWNTRKMTIVNALNYGNTIKLKKNKAKKTDLYKTSGKLIRTYASRNIGRAKGKFIFSAFAGSVSVMMLIVCVYIGVNSINILKNDNNISDFSIVISRDADSDIADIFTENEIFEKVEIKKIEGGDACPLELTLKDSSCYDEAKKIIDEFVKTSNSVLSVTYDDNFLFGTGLKEFLGAIFKTALVFLAFTWLTSIVSMINLTNTRIMNSQREYFIFRCMGMSRKQLIYSVLHEVLVFSAVSGAMGILLGIISSHGLGIVINDYEGEYFSAAFVPMLLVSVLSFASNIIVPSIFASPLIKKLFSTSSDIVNSNDMR